MSAPLSAPSRPSASRPSTSRPPARRRRVRAAAAVAATAAALAVWGLATALGVRLEVVPAGGEPQVVGAAHVVMTSLAAGLAGWALLAGLEWLTTRSRGVWTVAATVVLAASMGGPLAGATTAAVVTLAAMHLAVGAVLIPTLARS